VDGRAEPPEGGNQVSDSLWAALLGGMPGPLTASVVLPLTQRFEREQRREDADRDDRRRRARGLAKSLAKRMGNAGVGSEALAPFPENLMNWQ
jgi:hypothetical protein